MTFTLNTVYYKHINIDIMGLCRNQSLLYQIYNKCLNNSKYKYIINLYYKINISESQVINRMKNIQLRSRNHYGSPECSYLGSELTISFIRSPLKACGEVKHFYPKCSLSGSELTHT